MTTPTARNPARACPHAAAAQHRTCFAQPGHAASPPAQLEQSLIFVSLHCFQATSTTATTTTAWTKQRACWLAPQKALCDPLAANTAHGVQCMVTLRSMNSEGLATVVSETHCDGMVHVWHGVWTRSRRADADACAQCCVCERSEMPRLLSLRSVHSGHAATTQPCIRGAFRCGPVGGPGTHCIPTFAETHRMRCACHMHSTSLRRRQGGAAGPMPGWSPSPAARVERRRRPRPPRRPGRRSQSRAPEAARCHPPHDQMKDTEILEKVLTDLTKLENGSHPHGPVVLRSAVESPICLSTSAFQLRLRPAFLQRARLPRSLLARLPQLDCAHLSLLPSLRAEEHFALAPQSPRPGVQPGP